MLIEGPKAGKQSLFVVSLNDKDPGALKAERSFSFQLNFLQNTFRNCTFLQVIITFQYDMHAIAVGGHGSNHGFTRAVLAISQPELRVDRDVKLLTMPE